VCEVNERRKKHTGTNGNFKKDQGGRKQEHKETYEKHNVRSAACKQWEQWKKKESRPKEKNISREKKGGARGAGLEAGQKCVWWGGRGQEEELKGGGKVHHGRQAL